MKGLLTLKVPEKLQLYGLYVYYVVHTCDVGMLRVNQLVDFQTCSHGIYSAPWKEAIISMEKVKSPHHTKASLFP